MAKKKHHNRKVKIEIILGVLSIFISLYSLNKTNETSRQLLEYQLSQERLPRIMALNFELPMSFSCINDRGWDTIDYSSVSEEVCPIKIPIYNVGVGFAQNCKIAWNEDSINNACIKMKNILDDYYSIHEYERSKIYDESGERWAHKDYIFEKNNGSYETVTYRKYYTLEDDILGYSYDNEDAAIACEDVQIPYMIPVLEQISPTHLVVSEGLSVLLLEMANQKIQEPISFSFDVSYQDLTGVSYQNTIEATFLLDIREKTEEIAYQRSFKVT